MKLHVDHVWTYIEGTFPAGLVDAVTSYKIHGRWFAKSYRRGHWDGVKRFREWDKKELKYRFPTGFLERVTKKLGEENRKYTLIDNRVIEPAMPDYELHGVSLDGDYAFQADVLDDMLLHGRGVVRMATGAGKTITAAAAIKSIGQRTLWLTHRRTLLYQTRRVLQKVLKQPIGIIGDQQLELEDVTVGMVQTISKRKELDEWLQEVEVVIGDEIHHLESNQWYSTFSRLRAPYRYGLTATPCFDGAGMHLQAMTGEIIAEVRARELIDSGVLVKPKIYFVPILETQLPKDLPWTSVYAQGVVHNEQRHAKVVELAKAMQAQGKSCMTLVKRLNHGRTLIDRLENAGIPVAWIHGGVPEIQRLALLEQLFAGDLAHVVAITEVMGEGVDIPRLEALINATGMRGGGSARNSVEHEVGRGTVQVLGRGLRRAPGKTELLYFDLADQTHKYLTEAALERLSALEDEGYREGEEILSWSRFLRDAAACH
jgi:superfamily II DNA or RNA helicase